jgi:xylose isomerase
MKEQLRFAMSYWHTLTYMGNDPFGVETMFRPWDQNKDPMEVAKERVHVAFEFMEKMQIPYFCFHDRDIAPEGKDLEENQ